MEQQNNNIIVTGGAGYVGSHACKALKAAGYNPVTVDNLSGGHKELVKWGPLEECDLLGEKRMSEIFAQYRPAAVMHFAALIAVSESIEKPEIYHRNNVEGSASLIRVMQKYGVHNIVYSSSCSVYGDPETIPIPESAPLAPTHPYGENKRDVELMLAASGLSYVALRYFNAAGADPDFETGEMHEPETHAIPLAIMAAHGALPSFSIYGDDYETNDGSAVRDYVHVSDIASAHVKALNYLEGFHKPLVSGQQAASALSYAHCDGQMAIAGAKEKSISLNLGTGTGTSVKEIVAAIEKISGRKVPVKLSPRRPGDAPALVANPALAKSTLGWSPAFSFDEIIKTALGWYRKLN